MLWELLTSDQELFDAFYYGVLGTTYELNEEGQFQILDPDLYSTAAMWSARTPEFNRDQIGTPAEIGEIKEELEEKIAADDRAERYTSFAMDITPISAEYTTCNNVHSQYWYPLEVGYTDDVEGLAEYKKQMETAGIEKVKEEMQRQLDEYTAALKAEG